jgi:hypothetical protein
MEEFLGAVNRKVGSWLGNGRRLVKGSLAAISGRMLGKSGKM